MLLNVYDLNQEVTLSCWHFPQQPNAFNIFSYQPSDNKLNAEPNPKEWGIQLKQELSIYMYCVVDMLRWKMCSPVSGP